MVISVPAYFTDAERRALLDSARFVNFLVFVSCNWIEQSYFYLTPINREGGGVKSTP